MSRFSLPFPFEERKVQENVRTSEQHCAENESDIGGQHVVDGNGKEKKNSMANNATLQRNTGTSVSFIAHSPWTNVGSLDLTVWRSNTLTRRQDVKVPKPYIFLTTAPVL
ncbi:hypothetical protein F2P81_017400 [Scophthalmus maximus]|uniref:Uncharacterized protein n=1 Tax=Scophthalmus maximus TaxID=52904 RepID=A0A6A4SDM9_SCOMX|nr:hypothetical protein F2P81_017400 [Scophthalmus maximus]